MKAELHFITALISKNTWFADYHSKAVFHRKHQDIAETSIIHTSSSAIKLSPSQRGFVKMESWGAVTDLACQSKAGQEQL